MSVITSHIIENETVYRVVSDEEVGLRIQEPIGTVNKTETNRIDENTVEDVAYSFDIAIGDYVENTAIPRVTRIEPLPPTPETDQEKIARLEAKISIQEQQLAQQNADFTAFQDFYFEQNPTQV
jgi:hypothetical protein